MLFILTLLPLITDIMVMDIRRTYTGLTGILVGVAVTTEASAGAAIMAGDADTADIYWC